MSAGTALERRLSFGSGSRALSHFPPGFISNTDAGGSDYRAAPVVQARNKARGATLLKNKVLLENQALAKGTNLIFALGRTRCSLGPLLSRGQFFGAPHYDVRR